MDAREFNTELQVLPLSGHVGARIEVAPVGDHTSNAAYHAIRRAASEYGVVVLPGQDISTKDQVAFASMWGELIIHPIYPSLPGYPEVLEVINVGKSRTLTEIWHSDTSSLERPPAFTMLLAKQLPDYGGDTIFASQYQAFEDFTPRMKDLLEGLSATHTSKSESNDHPVVRTHPETGRKALFVNGYFVRHFVGMTEQESRPLLDFLFAWASKPEYSYRHRWTTHDLVIWDNRAVQHYAVHDHGEAVRTLHRVMVAGEKP